jgi:hypothetical protein
MRGLLADVNVQGHLPYLRRLLEILDLWSILAEVHLEFATFTDLGLPRDLDDRFLWNRCQADGWVLFTENRNDDDENSLHATLADSWRMGHLPVLTLANKGRFDHSPWYAKRVATDVAELLFGIAQAEYRDQPRIFVPRSAHPV